MAIGSGVAGLYVSGEQPAGGQATGFFASMSLLTIVLSALSIALGDGICEYGRESGVGRGAWGRGGGV